MKPSTAILAWAAVVASLGSGTPMAAIVTPCSTSQVTFGLQGETPAPADACFGWLEENGNPAFETGLVESFFGTQPTNAWSFVLKDQGGGATGGFAGLEFTLTADQASAGAYTLSWIDPAPADLPLTLDLAILVKAGQGTGGFLFEDIALPTTPTSGGGSYEVGVLNNQGRRLSLSHMSLVMRSADDPVTVLEPMPLALMAAGLLALGLRHRS